jgi:hypothetical protein
MGRQETKKRPRRGQRAANISSKRGQGTSKGRQKRPRKEQPGTKEATKWPNKVQGNYNRS